MVGTFIAINHAEVPNGARVCLELAYEYILHARSHLESDDHGGFLSRATQFRMQISVRVTM